MSIRRCDRGTLPFYFDTLDTQRQKNPGIGNTDHGMQADVNFETNLENRPKAHIEVTGRILAPITLYPDKINLRYITRNQSVSKTITVSYEKGANVDVTRAEIDLPGFSVKEIKRIPERSVVEITIEGFPISVSDARAVAANGRMKGTLRVYTNLEAYPELTASVMYLLKI